MTSLTHLVCKVMYSISKRFCGITESLFDNWRYGLDEHIAVDCERRVDVDFDQPHLTHHSIRHDTVYEYTIICRRDEPSISPSPIRSDPIRSRTDQ